MMIRSHLICTNNNNNKVKQRWKMKANGSSRDMCQYTKHMHALATTYTMHSRRCSVCVCVYIYTHTHTPGPGENQGRPAAGARRDKALAPAGPRAPSGGASPPDTSWTLDHPPDPIDKSSRTDAGSGTATVAWVGPGSGASPACVVRSTGALHGSRAGDTGSCCGLWTVKDRQHISPWPTCSGSMLSSLG